VNSLAEHLVAALAGRVLDTLATRGPGHCLQVSNVPREIAEGACQIVTKDLKTPDVARVVATDARRAWQATPAKIVELRNRPESAGGKLALFVPAGERLAAGDSFGRSTFEVLDLGDLYDTVIHDLRLQLQTLAPDLADRAGSIVQLARGDRRFSVTGREAAAFLARLTEHPSEDELGAALVELGLLPDRQIGHEDASDLSARLARNLEQVNKLTELAPPADRMQRLPLSPQEPEDEALTSEIRRALADGTVDSQDLVRRFDHEGSDGTPIDFARLLDGDGVGTLTELSIVELKGDFVEGTDPLTIRKANARVKIRYHCVPPAATIAGMRELRIELLRVGTGVDEVAEAGVEASKRGKSLPSRADGTWSIKIPTDTLDPGLHRLRLQAVNDDNLLLREVLSEPFVVEEEIDEADLPTTTVASVSAAKVETRASAPDEQAPGAPVISIAEPGKDPVDVYMIRFEGAARRFQLPVARPLAVVESYAFADPRSLARYRLSLRTGELEDTIMPDESLEVPEAFLVAREALLNEIARSQYAVPGGSGSPIVALCDLTGLGGSISRYLREWSTALETSDPRLLGTLLAIDQIEVSDSDLSAGLLVGPTHPLRIAWLARYQQLLEDWAGGESPTPHEASEVKSLLTTLAPANLPHVLAGYGGELRYLEPIDLYWGLWAPPATADVNALGAEIRTRLHYTRESVGSINVSDVVGRLRRYLAAHPYVDLLEMNFVQPGDAAIVLRALLVLQDDSSTADLRYVVRLFASELSRSDLGRALDDFMADPESSGARRDAADPFLASTDDPLTSKLTYSKHHVRELLSEPERFPAHLTFFLDWFSLDAVPVPPITDRRSFFASGLIVDPVTVYRAADGDRNPQWDEHIVVPTGTGDDFLDAAGAYARAAAAVLDREAIDAVPAVRLELDRVARSVLDAVHRTSDWVVVIDPIFSDDYLDSPPAPGESPRYLIDASDPGAPGIGRRIVVSTRSRDELAMLLRPIASRYGLDVPDDRVEVLLQALRALSPGLPLRLLNNRTQAVEAFSLSLVSLYLSAQGVLRKALAVPLDMHQDLFRALGSAEPDRVDLRRTDLAVVRLDPDKRRISVSLVEVKARSKLQLDTPAELVEQISGQLENSRSVLRSRLFAVDLRDRRDSLAAALLLRRLTRLLDRYLERAVRYGLMDDPRRVAAARRFIASLDGGYEVTFDKHAMIFDLEGASRPLERVDDVRVTRIGRDELLDVLTRTQTPVGTHVVDPGDTELVQTLLGLGGEHADVEAVPGVEDEAVGDAAARKPDGIGDEGETSVAREADLEERDDSGPRPADVLLIGATPESRQYGVIGTLVGRDEAVAFDLDGTNVVSVFGVQGSGKSYTVGDLIEAGAIRSPTLNRLPNPLATVVFHYSHDQTTVPEFASMFEANDDRADAERLAVDFGAEPAPLADVRILAPPDVMEERVREYPDLGVDRLLLAPSELDVNDWKLLMGVQGGGQLYVKAMSSVFRSLRQNLTMDSLKREVKASRSLSQAQKGLALTRIEFMDAFVADGAGVADLVRPGRLLVIDVRDPWLEQENALALFMVMLRVCAQARSPDGRSFNKLIVFDEAHRYMNNSRLTATIEQEVREMRHKGTTVVIASQDPPSLPIEIIELSSVVLAHRFTSPKWLQHLARVNEAFASGLTPAQFAGLKSGEAYAWSTGGSREFRTPQRVRMRPRLTRHGGKTQRAANNR
jgi:hypothetical protein